MEVQHGLGSRGLLSEFQGELIEQMVPEMQRGKWEGVCRIALGKNELKLFASSVSRRSTNHTGMSVPKK